MRFTETKIVFIFLKIEKKQNLEKMSQAYSDASKKSMYSSNVPYIQKYTDDADTDAQRNALKQYASQ